MGCKIDVKERKLTPDLGENDNDFGLFKDFEFLPLLFLAVDVKWLFLMSM